MKESIDRQVLKEQYKTSDNLDTRGNLHNYNANKTDWNIWCMDQMSLPHNARILELGCGTGEFWSKNSSNLKKDWDITLSDFSTGMIEGTRKRLEGLNFNFTYKEIDAEDIPYEDECFDVVIARHMLYLIPDIEKALSEISRVLVKGGTFYATTNTHDSMAKLNKLVEKFDSEIGLHNNGMCDRFDSVNGKALLRKYFSEVKMNVLQGKIVVDEAKPIVSYKASTIKGKSVLIGEKKQRFVRFIEDYIKENGHLEITTEACIFEAKKGIDIREITGTDYKDIYSLSKELGYDYPVEKAKERIEYILKNTKDIVLVAQKEDEVIGYIHGSPYELLYSDSLINILGFVIKEEYRNCGVGNLLINKLEYLSKAKGYSGIRLVSGADRLNAHKFYEKHGYTNRKNQKNFIKMFD